MVDWGRRTLQIFCKMVLAYFDMISKIQNIWRKKKTSKHFRIPNVKISRELALFKIS
jgi:hypothetical protein